LFFCFFKENSLTKVSFQTFQVKVIERLQEIEIAEHEIQRKHFELDSKIRKPAEAEKYRLETIAEAQKQKIILEAEAEAEALALKGEKFRFRKFYNFVEFYLRNKIVRVTICVIDGGLRSLSLFKAQLQHWTSEK